MTKKRFELVFKDYDTFSVSDNDYIQENKHYHTLEEIVALLNQLNTDSKKLNELHEKNQRLKSIFQSERRELIEQNNNYRKFLNELKEENEQLKKDVKCHEGRIAILIQLLDLADTIIDLGDDESAKEFWEKTNDNMDSKWGELNKKAKRDYTSGGIYDD